MTLQPSPYEIVRAIQDQQKATDRLVAVLIGMLDKSAPDPLFNGGPMQDGEVRDVPIPPRSRRLTDESGRPPVLMMVEGVEVKTTKRRAKLLSTVMESPLTLSDMTRQGIAPTVAGVKAQIRDTNADLERAGVVRRVRMQALPAQRRGARGGRMPALYALLGPKDDQIAPSLPPSVQDEAETGARPGQGSPARSAGGGEERVAEHGGQFVTSTGAGEAATPAADPAPAADQDSPDGASGMVGGFPVAAAPSHAEETGGCGDVETIAVEDAVDQPGVTGGESAARDAQRPSNRDVSADDEPSSGTGPQAEAPHAGTGSETLAGREGQSESDPALNAGRDVRVVPPQPAAKPKPAPVAPPKPTGRLKIEPGDLIAVDVKFRRVQTRQGSYEVAGANLARALDKLRGGQMFGLDVIAKVAGWPNTETARTALGFEMKRLREHGIDLYHDKINVRLRGAS